MATETVESEQSRTHRAGVHRKPKRSRPHPLHPRPRRQHLAHRHRSRTRPQILKEAALGHGLDAGNRACPDDASFWRPWWSANSLYEDGRPLYDFSDFAWAP